MLYAVSEVDLALRLFELGLFPEVYRKGFVQTVTQYAVDGNDGYVFESRDIRKIFTREEIKNLKLRVRTELVPGLKNARGNWEDNLPSDEDPESYIQPFSDLLSALEREFSSDPDVMAAVKEESVLVKRWIENTLQDLAERGDRPYDEPDYDAGDYSRSEGRMGATERSIFDDIDL